MIFNYLYPIILYFYNNPKSLCSMKTILQSKTWLMTLCGNMTIFTLAFVINWIYNTGHHLVNHEHFTYWYMAGGLFFIFISLFFFLFSKFILKK